MRGGEFVPRAACGGQKLAWADAAQFPAQVVDIDVHYVALRLAVCKNRGGVGAGQHLPREQARKEGGLLFGKTHALAPAVQLSALCVIADILRRGGTSEDARDHGEDLVHIKRALKRGDRTAGAAQFFAVGGKEDGVLRHAAVLCVEIPQAEGGVGGVALANAVSAKIQFCGEGAVKPAVLTANANVRFNRLPFF